MSGIAVTRLLAGLAVLCLFAMGVLWSSGVKAQEEGSGCVPLAKLLEGISGDRYSETPWFAGSIRRGQVAIMGYRNKETGTFTLFTRPTPGTACPIMDGTGLLNVDDMPVKSGKAT